MSELSDSPDIARNNYLEDFAIDEIDVRIQKVGEIEKSNSGGLTAEVDNPLS